MNEIQFSGVDTLIISIFVLFLGSLLTRRIKVLQKYSIPQAVTGGLLLVDIGLEIAEKLIEVGSLGTHRDSWNPAAAASWANNATASSLLASEALAQINPSGPISLTW